MREPSELASRICLWKIATQKIYFPGCFFAGCFAAVLIARTLSRNFSRALRLRLSLALSPLMDDMHSPLRAILQYSSFESVGFAKNWAFLEERPCILLKAMGH